MDLGKISYSSVAVFGDSTVSNRAAGEEGRGLLLQLHCPSTGGHAHMQGTPTASCWGRGTAKAPFQSQLSAVLLCFPQDCKTQASLPTSPTSSEPTPTRCEPPCVLFAAPSQTPDQTPSTSIALNGIYRLAMPMPSHGLMSF